MNGAQIQNNAGKADAPAIREIFPKTAAGRRPIGRFAVSRRNDAFRFEKIFPASLKRSYDQNFS